MKKFLKYFLIGLLAIIILVPASVYLWLNSLKVSYSGTETLKGLKEETTVHYDEFGVPHIYAQNEEDAYFALGYCIARERWFQMEIVKRVAAGRLSEIVGEAGLESDKLYRTLGLTYMAEKSAKLYLSERKSPFQKAVYAYVDGFNAYIETGNKPVEFYLMGIPAEKLTFKDIYTLVGYMAFGFSEGFKEDPICTEIYSKLGPEYFKDINAGWNPGDQIIPIRRLDTSSVYKGLAIAVSEVFAKSPAPAWIGSNGWAISGKRTKSGKPILCSDTHMGYSQPSVWFEAHMEFPGHRFYGNFLAGVPAAMIGHNQYSGWGLTMFENDDTDFYTEELNPQNPNQVKFKDAWEDMQIQQEIIKVKDKDEVVLEVKTTRHGPLVNDLFAKKHPNLSQKAVSFWWTYHKEPNRALEAAWLLLHAKGFDEAFQAASLINAPGLNAQYADIHGNIAWWACAKLVKRSPQVNSKLFLNGSSGDDEPLGWYNFSENPHSINPLEGFIYSANNQPDTMAGILYPGYYVPQDRAARIVKLLKDGNDWDSEKLKSVITDVKSDQKSASAKLLASILEKNTNLWVYENDKKILEILKTWDGNHTIEDVAPVIFYKFLYHVLHDAMSDEMGEDLFKVFNNTHLMQRTWPALLRNDSSIWWDNIATKELKENQANIVATAWTKSMEELKKQLGEKAQEWKWGKVHYLQFGHPVGRMKPFDKVFNTGPIPAPGGSETINNISFDLNGDGIYPSKFGPAMRIILDWADFENSISVLPAGQSGYFMSKHYDDQMQMYANGEFRKQMMNPKEIEEKKQGSLILKPGN